MDTKHKLDEMDFGLLGIAVYRGCIVSKLVGGYSIFGTKYTKAEQIDEAIEKAGKAIEGSLRVHNNGNMATTNNTEP